MFFEVNTNMMREIIRNTIKQNKYRIIICILFVGINIYVLTIPAKIIGYIIDLLYNIQSNEEIIVTNLIYLISIGLFLVLVRLVWKYYVTYLPRIFEMNIRNSLFSHLLRIKVSKLQERKNGELMSYFVKDVADIRAAIYNMISYGTRIIFTLVFVAYSMIQNINLHLTLIALTPLVIAAVLTFNIRKKMDKNYQISQESFTELSEYIQESTDAIRTIKAYHGEDEQIKHFISLNNKVKDSNYKVAIYSSMLSMCINICFGLSYGLTLIFGSKLVLDGVITVGSFIAFNTYIALFVGPVSWMARVISKYRNGKLAYNRLESILKIELELNDMKKIKSHESILKGDILIKNLSFNYPGFIDRALSDININIKQGETLGVIGKIGSGKSTLMNLLVKLYPVGRDKININGIDINDIPTDILRENICYITQDNFLFSATLKENINLFRDEYDDEDIKQSIKNSIIYDEIMNLPNNIHTVIGERGVDLSGGQKQRIAISRAFLNNSDIVIFDDTFSALDNKTEQKLLRNIKKLVKNKTCIIVSNRISDIKHADKIVVLDNGNIVESGTHRELLEAKGTYNKFYEEQAIKVEDSILN
ncbi:MAG: ABC transporter ATP-binding protein/permease [Clostridia bacterium]|nr:ABC transporter ATP-binding protein/permease [Clostridia bacterium]